MLQLFKKANPINYALLGLCALLLLGFEVGYAMQNLDPVDIPFWSPISPIYAAILNWVGQLMVFIVAFLIIQRTEVLSPNQTTGFFLLFIIIAFGSQQNVIRYWPWLAACIAFVQLFSMAIKPKSRALTFWFSAAVGALTLYNVWFCLMLVLLFPAITSFKEFKPRELILAGVGFVLPAIYASSFAFLITSEWAWFIHLPNYSDIAGGPVPMPLVVLLGLYLLAGFAVIGTQERQKNYLKKLWSLSIWFIAIMLLVGFLSGQMVAAIAIVSAPVMAFSFTRLIDTLPKKWLKELVPILLIILVGWYLIF